MAFPLKIAHDLPGGLFEFPKMRVKAGFQAMSTCQQTAVFQRKVLRYHSDTDTLLTVLKTDFPLNLNNVVKTTINHPLWNGLYHHIPPIYGEIGDGLFLSYPHDRNIHHHQFPCSPCVGPISLVHFSRFPGLRPT